MTSHYFSETYDKFYQVLYKTEQKLLKRSHA
jgi:hypothetical protein